MARPWKPSKRATELIHVMWDAFLDGDRAVYLTMPETARYTGVSLVFNGVAEWAEPVNDNGYARRIRLSNGTLEANGIYDRDWRRERDGFAAWDADDDDDRHGHVATESEAHAEWHRNSGVPMGTPGCPQDACHPDEHEVAA